MLCVVVSGCLFFTHLFLHFSVGACNPGLGSIGRSVGRGVPYFKSHHTHNPSLTLPPLKLGRALVAKERHAYVDFGPAAGADVSDQGAEARVGVDAGVGDVLGLGDGALLFVLGFLWLVGLN